jgi:hypothetical protein
MHAPVLCEHWPNFLEGLFFWRDGKNIHVRWRGVERIYSADYRPIE